MIARLTPFFLALTVASVAAAPPTGPGNDPPASAPAASRPAAVLPPDPLPPPAPVDPALARLLPAVLNPETREDARRQALAYLDEHPDSGRAELLVAMSYHQEQRYGLARPHFERSIRLDPGFAPTLHFYGYCLYYLGQKEPARQAFARHLELQPEEGNSHFGLGLIALDSDDLDEAERRFTEAIRLQAPMPHRRKDVAAAHTRLGDIDARRGDHEAARDQYRTAATMFPDLYGAHLKLSRALRRLGDDAGADAAYEAYEAALRRVRPPQGFPQ